MWTSEQSRRLPVEESGAEVGVVTLGGDPAGVSLGGERRWLPVYSPGGYSWRPNVGDKVLVLKAGAERELPCILGRVQQGENLRPGEARLSGSDSSVSLLGKTVGLNGRVEVNGVLLETLVANIVWEILEGLEE